MTLSEARPSAPEGMTSEQVAVWNDSVTRLPADYLPREQHALLAEYCRAVTRARFIGAGSTRSSPNGWVQPGGVERYAKLVATADKCVRSMTALARALRITNQSRFKAEKAGRHAMRGPVVRCRGTPISPSTVTPVRSTKRRPTRHGRAATTEGAPGSDLLPSRERWRASAHRRREVQVDGCRRRRSRPRVHASRWPLSLSRGEDASGTTLSEQTAFRDRCEAVGASYAIVRTVDEAERILVSWARCVSLCGGLRAMLN